MAINIQGDSKEAVAYALYSDLIKTVSKPTMEDHLTLYAKCLNTIANGVVPDA